MRATAADKAEFKERVRGWAEKLDVRVRSIAVRPMTTKWASYSTTGRLTFDATLLELREELQDYVIVHELLHLRYRTHGKRFKAMMSALVPNWRELESQHMVRSP